MASRRTLTWEVPGTPEQVLRRCADPQVAQARAESEPTLQARVTHLDVDPEHGILRSMGVLARLPDSWVPAALASAMPAQPHVERCEAWTVQPDGSAQAEVELRLHAIPATRAQLEASLVTAGEGRSTLAYHLEVDIAVPVLGKRIERTILDHMSSGFDKEAHVIASS